jgi:ferredoxin
MIATMFPVGLDRIVDILSHLQSPAIRVNPHQCTRVRHRRSTCTRCADACPTQAITWHESLKVESAKCIDCGICATVCPTGALEAQAPTNAELLGQIKARVAENRSVAFACPRYLETTRVPSAQVVQVKCLGRLDESILFGAVAEGAPSVTLLDGACADCPHAIGRTIAAQTAQRTNALLSAFGIARQIVFDARRLLAAETQPSVATPADGMSRRAFFDFLRRETIKVTAATVSGVLSSQETPSTAEAKLPVGGLPTRIPAKHQMLLTALRRIGKPVIAEWSSGIWGQFGFNEKCNGCQMCAFFCPTGALSKLEQDGKLGVAFKPALCTDCRLCQELCHLDGVTLSPTIDLNQIVNEAVVPLLMVDAESALWKLSPEERFKKTVLSALGKI